MNGLISYIVRVWDKLQEIVQYPAAWIVGFGLFLVDAVSGGRFIIYMVVIAAAVDMFCGIAVSRKKKTYTRSELMRSTVEKLAVYGPVMLVFLCVDHLIEMETSFTTDITSGLVGVIITLTEAVSFTASLLILFPKSAFLRLFQKALTGELARKLDCDESEVNAILKAARGKQPRGKDGRFKPRKKSC